MTTILLARHGESDWNHLKRWQGFTDRPLTDLGRRQAAELAARLEKTELDAVYSSDSSAPERRPRSSRAPKISTYTRHRACAKSMSARGPA